MLAGKKILIGITGGIAAYKIISLIRLLVKANAEVKVILTPAAKEFVSPLVLSTLSKNDVRINIFDENNWNNHVMLGRWADLFVIAPLSCNTLSKMAHGGCDNLLLAVYLSATCNVLCVPAMDEDMWKHPSTNKNIDLLKSYGNEVMEVKFGELASGLTGNGRMAEPEEIFHRIQAKLNDDLPLKNKKVLITAGPTYEKIDAVRFIGNFSTGKMGYALAEAFALKGAEVILVSGPTHLKITQPGIKRIDVVSASEMYHEVQQYFGACNIAIMSAAVADYSPEKPVDKKIKKSNQNLSINLKQTPDILAWAGRQKKSGQFLIGFALETDEEEINAIEKLKNKNADLIVLNSLNHQGAGFGYDTNKVTIFNASGKLFESELILKKNIAEQIAGIVITSL